MIIVSQDEENIVNFDRVDNIGIEPVADKSGRYVVVAEYSDGGELDLGIYKCRQSAKAAVRYVALNCDRNAIVMPST